MVIYLVIKFYRPKPPKYIDVRGNAIEVRVDHVYPVFVRSDAMFFIGDTEIESIEFKHKDHYILHCADGSERHVYPDTRIIAIEQDQYYDAWEQVTDWSGEIEKERNV